MLGQLVTVIHIFISCFLILIVLLQQGKGADAGATFGGGGQTFFGASGADNLLTKVTTITAIAFMCTSILLATSIKQSITDQGELMRQLDVKTAPATAPEATETTPAASVDEKPVEAESGKEAASNLPAAAKTTEAVTEEAPVAKSVTTEAPAASTEQVSAQQPPVAGSQQPSSQAATSSKSETTPATESTQAP